MSCFSNSTIISFSNWIISNFRLLILLYCYKVTEPQVLLLLTTLLLVKTDIFISLAEMFLVKFPIFSLVSIDARNFFYRNRSCFFKKQLFENSELCSSLKDLEKETGNLSSMSRD